MSSALLVGATGLIGGFVLEKLLANPAYDRVVVITRKTLAREHSKINQIIADASSLADSALPPVDDVYCCLGTTIKTAGSQAAFRAVDYDYVVALAKLTRAIGAKQFLLVSALGADATSKVFYNRVKGEAEHELGTMDWPSLHIFRPSLLLGPRNEFRFGERLGQPLACAVAPLLFGNARRYRPIQAADVAQKMIQIAEQDLAGQHIHYFHEL